MLVIKKEKKDRYILLIKRQLWAVPWKVIETGSLSRIFKVFIYLFNLCCIYGIFLVYFCTIEYGSMNNEIPWSSNRLYGQLSFASLFGLVINLSISDFTFNNRDMQIIKKTCQVVDVFGAILNLQTKYTFFWNL